MSPPSPNPAQRFRSEHLVRLARAGRDPDDCRRKAERRGKPLLKTAEVRERLAAEGGEVLGGSPETIRIFPQGRARQVGTVVQESGARAE